MPPANLPLITVCIPTYCRYNLLERALKSVLNQNFSSVEIIISDNASADGSWNQTKQLSDWDQRILTRRNQNNLGWTGNLNECIKIARGEFLVFLCDDDEMLPGMLELESDFLKAHPSAGLVHSATETFNIYGKSSLNVSTHRQLLKGGIDALTETALSFSIMFSSVMVRRICFDRLGFFIENISADYEMWSRISTQYDIGYIDKPLVRYYQHAISPNMTIERYISESEELGRIVADYFPEDIRTSSTFRCRGDKQLFNGLRSLGLQSFQIGDWRRGIAFLNAAKQRSKKYTWHLFVKDLLFTVPRRMKFLFLAKDVHSTSV